MLNRVKQLFKSALTDAPAPNHETPQRPTRTFAEFFTHLKTLGFAPRTVIDVGVARGTPALYEAFPDAYLILVEPVEDFLPDLERIVARYGGEYHRCALMSQAGQAQILKAHRLHGSSMMHSLKEGDDRLQDVAVETLDGLLGGRELNGPILLKTDCQGGDFDVIKGGEYLLSRCDVVIMEMSLFKFWGDHHPEPLDILQHMSDQGFVIYDFLDGMFRPLDNALGQIDVAFVKRDSAFRDSHMWARRPANR